jgi:uncharacterized protein
MDPVIVKLDGRLAEAGDALPLAGHLDQASYSLGDHVFDLPSGIDYDLVLTNAGEGILVTGILRAHVVGVCDRCLEEARFDVAGEVDGYYLFEEPAGSDLPDDEDDDESDVYLVGEDDEIDLADALNCALIMETPYIVLCRPDCKGLCPTCGANLNDGPCGCERDGEQDRLTASPFAALRDLKLDDAEPQDGPEGRPSGASS